jgi:hypothetical protein
MYHESCSVLLPTAASCPDCFLAHFETGVFPLNRTLVGCLPRSEASGSAGSRVEIVTPAF